MDSVSMKEARGACSTSGSSAPPHAASTQRDKIGRSNLSPLCAAQMRGRSVPSVSSSHFSHSAHTSAIGRARLSSSFSRVRPSRASAIVHRAASWRRRLQSEQSPKTRCRAPSSPGRRLARQPEAACESAGWRHTLCSPPRLRDDGVAPRRGQGWTGV
eukprot:scaffold17607_cov110-Isochrysis_galbana.AAC.2